MPHPATPCRRLGQALAHAGASLCLVAGLALGSLSAQAQILAMPDSTNNRLVGFSALDGSLINAELFTLAGGTPIHALGVGNEIWVSEQIGDRISRWGADGNFLGQIGGSVPGGGLDNVRGMGLVGDTVYVTNAGTNNGAPGAAVLMFSTAGAPTGAFSAAGTAPSPFGVLAHQGGLLISSSSANDDIHRFSLAGAPLGSFHNSTTLNFAEQMVHATNGDIVVAGFSSNNLVRLDATTGSFLTSYAAPGARGVAQLGNGNLMWTSGAGAFVLDINTGTSTQVYTGGGRYLEVLTVVPEPSSVLLWVSGLLAVGVVARRRSRV